MLTDSPGLPLPDRWGMRYSYVYEPDHPELPRAVFAVCAEGDWQLEMPINSSVADDDAKRTSDVAAVVTDLLYLLLQDADRSDD